MPLLIEHPAYCEIHPGIHFLRANTWMGIAETHKEITMKKKF